MNLHPIYALVIASRMVPAVALALMADRTLAAEPQMPKDLQGIWCSYGGTLGDESAGYYREPCNNPNSERLEMEITATEVTAETETGNLVAPISCVVRQITKFDVCPWGMIFKNRKRAQALRSFQINPWGPGYHIILRCTGTDTTRTIKNDWLVTKGYYLEIGVPRDYRCPWDRRGAR
jgi:hypothetical protein